MRSSIALSGAMAATVAALQPIEAIGNKFFTKDGNQFFMKGVAYQLWENDPLIDSDQCKRDAKLMKELGVNAIRTYHVDAKANHDDCMQVFDDAGIYLTLDLDTFDTYVFDSSVEPPILNWNQTQFDRYAAVMDTFQKYDNLLAFYVGNENISKRGHSRAAPYIKAAARDMKAYRDKKGYRKIPIGYSAADIVELRPMLQNYLTCGGNSSEIVDFFALNSYSWCDPSDYKKSSYDKLQQYAKDFPVPIFFSETGCNVPGPRLWDDQDAVFGDKMKNDWSGSIVYEWIQESNNYGLITYGPPAGDGAAAAKDVKEGFTRKGEPTPVSPDFDNLKSKWATIKPTGVKKGDYDAKHVSTRDCPSSTNGGWWNVDGNVRLPTLGEEVMGDFTKIPSATADPSDNAGGKKGDTGSEKGSDGKSDEENSASGLDKQITVVGSAIFASILGLALWL